MADGSKGDAPSASGDVADNRLPSSVKHCTVCKVPVKDHAGPHGRSKCLLGLLTALRERVDCLEVEAARHDVDFRQQENSTCSGRKGSLLRLSVLSLVFNVLNPISVRSSKPWRRLPLRLLSRFCVRQLRSQSAETSPAASSLEQ